MEKLTKRELKRIRAELLMRDVSFAVIARDFHVSRQTVSTAIRRISDSELAQEIRDHVDEILSRPEDGD